MKKILFFLALSFLWGCSSKKSVDSLIYNAHIYTVDSTFSEAEAMAISDGKIIALGKSVDLQKEYSAKEEIDAKGKAIYPGFIDGHAHFLAYGLGLNTVDLVGTKSWGEIVAKVKAFASQNTEDWILGRGWDQNDWNNKNFPSNAELTRLFPNQPVLLNRVDGHAAIANQKALDLAGIKPGQTLVGGEIGTENGKLTGLLVDNAVDLVSSKIPKPTTEQVNKALLAAQKNCFAAGLTTVVDCGLDHQAVNTIDALQKSAQLKMRLFVMLSDSPENFDFLVKNGAIKTDRLNVRAFKVYADGALGSRGACLLNPYADQAGHYGFLLSPKAHYLELAQKIADKGFQMCTHAIGDSANREILNVYTKVLKGKNDLRWRIEHAQVLNPADFAKFGANSVVPSVQPTHATSDMYWAGERLGTDRIKGAYAYQQLLQQNGWLILGTDFPVEDISPMRTFYAAVVRKDAKGWPSKGFQTENALSRADALRGMTIWAAKGNFEEKEKGSMEVGKFADFIILDRDILKVAENQLLGTKVLNTYVNGEKVY